MDLMSIIWLIVIIAVVITYKADTETCKEIITNPLEYCEESKACKIIEERKEGGPSIKVVDFNNMPELEIIE